jgi:isopentenyl phosphate kinase
VCDALVRAGLAPVPVDPFSAGSAAALVRPARQVLAAGFLPVLYGDVVAGARPGSYTVLSGDRIVSVLAAALGARRVGMATDVEGILRGGKPLRALGRRERVDFFPVEGDVTGAMEGKVRELRGLARRGVAAFVFSGRGAGSIRRFLAGEPVGTRIR